MNYHQITVHTVTEAVEAISYAFTELGAGGVEIFDPKDILNQEKVLYPQIKKWIDSSVNRIINNKKHRKRHSPLAMFFVNQELQ